ncbi:MAG TPA: glycosyltransferase, partial [Chthoniobacterales bacterium]|nr:glycosyltransferase [Chthoniobacterales bacterium]
WEDFYPPGAEPNGGTVIRRFPVDLPRNPDAFNRLSAFMFENQAGSSLREQEEWMRAQGPMSSALFEYLAAEKENYDAFVFFGYLYATTYFGLPLVKEKAYLAPLAHDEWPIYFGMWDRLFALPQRLMFNTIAERDFIRRRFPKLPLAGRTVGVGIEPPAPVDREAFAKRYQLPEPFLLYVGRIDEAKGCKTLFEYFMRARAEALIDQKLVLIGKEVMPVPFHDDIIHLGFVSDREKWEAMAACDWLVVPSPHESLSMVLLEAWTMRRPALVNAACAVLRSQCEQANGGMWYDSYEEWLTVLKNITPAEKEKLGQQGSAFVTERYSWERVENDYLEVLSERASETGRRTARDADSPLRPAGAGGKSP